MLYQMNKKTLIKFVALQQELMSSFLEKYPTVKDYDWLLDFPKNGVIQLSNELWHFTKHGKGIRFCSEKLNGTQIVDIKCNISRPELFDTWRLSQYFEAYNEGQLKKILDEMIFSGELIRVSEELYEFKIK